HNQDPDGFQAHFAPAPLGASNNSLRQRTTGWDRNPRRVVWVVSLLCISSAGGQPGVADGGQSGPAGRVMFSPLFCVAAWRGLRWSRGSDPRLLRLTMNGLLDRHISGATPCIKDRPRSKVRPTLSGRMLLYDRSRKLGSLIDVKS